MLRLLSTIAKIGIASLLVGVALAKLDLSAEQILRDMGLTPEKVLSFIDSGVRWAVPNIVLGSIVVVPVWLVVYLFRPPRG